MTVCKNLLILGNGLSLRTGAMCSLKGDNIQTLVLPAPPTLHVPTTPSPGAGTPENQGTPSQAGEMLQTDQTQRSLWFPNS